MLKRAVKWLYDWATVLTATIVGSVSTAFELLDVFSVVDLTTILPPETAVKITTGVAIAKGLHAFIVSRAKA